MGPYLQLRWAKLLMHVLCYSCEICARPTCVRCEDSGEWTRNTAYCNKKGAVLLLPRAQVAIQYTFSPEGPFLAPIFGTFLSWQCSSSSTLYIQRWREKFVRGCKIFCQSYRKLQIGRWGVASLPWQHYSGKFKISFFLVKPCTVLVCPFQEYLWGPFSGPFLDPF